MMDRLYPCLCILFVLLLLKSESAQCEVTKCCSSDHVLNIENDVPECEPATSQTVWDAYNIPTLPNWPNCGVNIVRFAITDDYIELNGCLDRDVNDTLVAVSCSDHTAPTASGVHLVNKCCPYGKSYDHSERLCIPNPQIQNHSANMFGNSSVVFQHSVPQCADDEVFVEYSSTTHSFRFKNKNFEVTGDILPSDKFCIEDLVNINQNEAYNNENHIIVRSCRPRTICNLIPCIYRCCRPDEAISKKLGEEINCKPHPNNTNLIPTFHDVILPLTQTQKVAQLKEYGVLHNWKCNERYILKPETQVEDLHYIHTDGRLYREDESNDAHEYCIENTIARTGSIKPRTFMCFDNVDIKNEDKFKYYPYGLTVSCIFLALTLIVYLSLPKVRTSQRQQINICLLLIQLLNLPGKTLVCYVSSSLAMYILLAYLQFHNSSRITFCYEMALILLYCTIATFCWQSVMCFDIWLSFGSLRSSFMMRHNTRSQRKLLYYSAYAWGMPLLWVIFTVCADKYKLFPRKWNPSIAENSCFFSNTLNWREHFLFFIVPAGLHVITNTVLFIITSINCSRVKNDIHRMQCISDESSATIKRKKFVASRAIFIMNLKLFTVMGISWILEITSEFYINTTFEMILDIYNILLGLFIFIIFVFKRKVLYELKCRFGFESKNTGLQTPRSTTTTHINLKDMANDKNSPLISASTNTLQVPTFKK